MAGTPTQIQLRRDTAANWALSNPVLAAGEVGVDLTAKQYRIGDGVSSWSTLTPYASLAADNARPVASGQGDPYLQPYVDVGSPTTDALVPWTPAMSSARFWYRAEDSLNIAGNVAQSGDAVWSIPNRMPTVSRTDGLAMPLVPKAISMATGIAANAPLKRGAQAVNGIFPVGFGAAVSGGLDDRLSTQLGAISPTLPHWFVIIAAMRGTNFAHLMSVSGTAGSTMVSSNASRQLRAGTDTQIIGAFADSVVFMLTIQRRPTEKLFRNALAAASYFGDFNGAQTPGNTTGGASTSNANVALQIGNRYDTDAGMDGDIYEIVGGDGASGPMDFEIQAVQGYLANKYAMQSLLPGDHPYRSAVQMVPAGTTTPPDFAIATNPWGYRQVVKGLISELADGNIAASDGAQGTDASRRVLYDLLPSERRRLATLVRGKYAERAALGTYIRGGWNLDAGSGLYKGVTWEYASQKRLHYEYLRDCGAAGFMPEYWSPAPYWKTTSSYANGVLWAGGAYSRATTLDSIRTTGPTITAVTKASPGVVTYSGTDPAAGALVYIAGVVGMTQLNGRFYKIASLNTGTKTFALTDTASVNVDTSAYGTWTSGGTLGFDYAAQCDAFGTQVVLDLEKFHADPDYPIAMVGFGLQNEPSGTDATYGSCLYTTTLYLDVLKMLIPKIRASTILSSFGGRPNTVQIHGESWAANWGTIGVAIVADTVVLTTGKTVVQELAAWSTHNIGAINADPNVMITGNGTSSDATGKEYYNYRLAASNPTGIPVFQSEYERFDTPASRDAQFAHWPVVHLNFLNWTQAPYLTKIHDSKPWSDPTVERYAYTAWRPSGDTGPAATTYATGLDYGKFATIDCNLNADLPFIRRLRNAQWLLTQEYAYSATKKVGGCFDAYGKALAFAVNNSAAPQSFSINLGAQVRTMRGYQSSATTRDTLVGAGATISTQITTTVPAYSMQVWAEA